MQKNTSYNPKNTFHTGTNKFYNGKNTFHTGTNKFYNGKNTFHTWKKTLFPLSFVLTFETLGALSKF